MIKAGSEDKKTLKYLFAITVVASALFITGCEMGSDFADLLEFILAFFHMF